MQVILLIGFGLWGILRAVLRGLFGSLFGVITLFFILPILVVFRYFINYFVKINFTINNTTDLLVCIVILGGITFMYLGHESGMEHGFPILESSPRNPYHVIFMNLMEFITVTFLYIGFIFQSGWLINFYVKIGLSALAIIIFSVVLILDVVKFSESRI